MIAQAKSLTFQNHLIFLKKIHESAKMPSQVEGDVGFDISCVDDFFAPAGSVAIVHTGLQFAEAIEPLILENKVLCVPFMKIEGRSGLASNGIFPVGGIIDPRYRGEIKVALFNSTKEDRFFQSGDRVAQIVVYYTLSSVNAYSCVRFVESPTVQESTRGSAGFGSSGR